jgi:hypothetical protein
MLWAMKAVSGFAVLGRAARQMATAALVSHLLVALAGAAAPTSNDQAVTTAKWVPRKIKFMYSAVAPSSSTTYYSCDNLQERITAILRQLGARDEVVKPFGCFTNGGPEKWPGVDATFSVLEPAGTGDQSGADKVQAHWEKVTLNTDNSCALIEQVKRRILPLFVTRNQTSGCSTSFSLEVLRPSHDTASVAHSAGMTDKKNVARLDQPRAITHPAASGPTIEATRPLASPKDSAVARSEVG